MSKPVISQHEFRQKLKELLMQQSYYKWDMSVIPAAPGTAGLTGSGYDVTGGALGRDIVELEKAIRAEFDIAD